MGFLDKAKEKAGKLMETTKEKVDDMKDKRKADDLLDDLGRILYRQRTGRGEADDEQEITRIVTELQALEAEGTESILGKPAEAAAPAAASPADSGPTLPPAGGPTLPPAGGPTLPPAGGPTLPPAAPPAPPVPPAPPAPADPSTFVSPE